MSPATQRPTLFVLLGAAGDLARRLVVPALFALHRSRMLPPEFRLVGLDRAPLDAQALAEQLREGCVRFGRSATPSNGAWEAFTRGLAYQYLDLSDPDAYRSLPAFLEESAQGLPATVQQVFYLATPAFLFAPATAGLGSAGLVKDRALSRLVVEKPIGSDLASFHEIDGVLRSWLDESQIFRMDHYLVDAWTRYPAVDFPNYPPGSWGPESAEDLISRDGCSWLAPSLPEPQP